MKIIILLPLIGILFIACKKNTLTVSELEKAVKGGKFDIDTLHVGEKYSTYINYENLEHDRFNKNLFREDKLRSIISLIVIDSIPRNESDILYNKTKDTIFTHDPSFIQIDNISFTEKGEYYISGLIEDRIFIDKMEGNQINTKVALSIFHRKIIVVE